VSSVNQVEMAGIVSLTSGPTPSNSAKTTQAAQQFEALLIAHILRQAHESGGGWLGSDDSSGSCATDFAEEQLANTVAQEGGFGLAKMIAQNLEKSQ